MISKAKASPGETNYRTKLGILSNFQKFYFSIIESKESEVAKLLSQQPHPRSKREQTRS